MTPRLFLTGVLAVLASAALAKAPDPAVLAPETAIVYVQFDNLTRLEEDWKKTGPYQLWADPAMQRFTKPLRDRLAAEAGQANPTPQDGPVPDTFAGRLSTLTWKEFRELFPEGFAVFISDVDVQAEGYITYDLCVVGKAGKERKDYERIARIISPPAPADPQRRTFDVAGVTVYETRYPIPRELQIGAGGGATQGPKPEALQRGTFTTSQLAVMDGWVLIADGTENTLRRMILRHKGKGEGSLAASARFRSATRDVEKNARIVLYADLETAGAQVARLLKAALAPPAGDAQSSRPALNVDALGLTDLRAVTISFLFDDKGLRSRSRLSLNPQPRGIGRIFDAYGRECQFKTARFAPEDVLAYSASQFDFAQLYHSIRALATAAMPSSEIQWDALLSMARGKLGFDPVTEIVDALGGEIGQFTPRPAPGSTQPSLGGSGFAVIAECRDGNRIRSAIDKIEQTLLGDVTPEGGTPPESPLEKIDYLGFTIQTLKAQGGAMGPMPAMGSLPAWCVTDSWIVVGGSADQVKDILRRVAGKETRSFATSAAFRNSRALHEGKVIELSYSDTAEIAQTLFKDLQMMSFMATMLSRGRIPSNLLDFASMPDATLFKRTLGPSVGATMRDADGLCALWTLQQPKDLK